MRAFTLLELMVAISLLGIFFGVAQETMLTGLRAVGSSDQREQVRLEVVRALEQITREAMMSSNVDTAAATQFQFDADLNGDGDATDSGESNILYQQSGSTLQRVQGGTTVTLVPDLSSVAFTYRDSTGAVTATLANITLVQITLAGVKGNDTITLSSAVRLR